MVRAGRPPFETGERFMLERAITGVTYLVK